MFFVSTEKSLVKCCEQIRPRRAAIVLKKKHAIVCILVSKKPWVAIGCFGLRADWLSEGGPFIISRIQM